MRNEVKSEGKVFKNEMKFRQENLKNQIQFSQEWLENEIKPVLEETLLYMEERFVCVEKHDFKILENIVLENIVLYNMRLKINILISYQELHNKTLKCYPDILFKLVI